MDGMHRICVRVFLRIIHVIAYQCRIPFLKNCGKYAHTKIDYNFNRFSVSWSVALIHAHCCVTVTTVLLCASRLNLCP